MSEEILHRVEAGVAWITLNRPDVGNALAPEHRQMISEHLDRASGDADVRVVVLSATGSAFCTGGDLSAPAPEPTATPNEDRPTPSDAVHTGGANAQRLIESLLDCDKPVLASVNGTAAGLGAHMVFACDLVVAASESSFIEVFIRRGLVPDAGGAYLLPRLIGPLRTKYLMFFGDAMSAEEAYRVGLVTAVVPPHELDGVVSEWVRRLAASPTAAIAEAKRLVNASFESDRATSFGDELAARARILSSHDAQEGITAFRERRRPTFYGR